ncbi:hypothetical protein PSTT_12042 [Puccinia striiformis]|uniref:Phosphatidate cytidylyltransferase n=1 Tax=Puccinia striiformis TaxID=27350 RepID=A0A2S4UXU2_9BASI|nr:hypothetical protein PSTT_12042 [Puccinia striiformis]
MAKRPTPAFATKGSFHALAVENNSESSEEEEEKEEDKEEQEETPKQIQITRNNNNNNNNNNKKKNQKKQAKTLLLPKKEEKEESKPSHLNLSNLSIPTQIEPIHSELNTIRSPSISTTTSLITSPSTTDFDDQEEELNSISIDKEEEEAEEAKQEPKHTQNNIPSPHTSSPSTTPTNHTHRIPNHEPNSSDNQFGADHTPGKKWQTVLTRVFWSLVMVTGFITLMALGHLYLIILVFICQLLVFREVTNLFQVGYKVSAREHAQKLQAQSHHPHHHHTSSQSSISKSGSIHSPGSSRERALRKGKDLGHKNRVNKLMSWYFFGVANYFLYGESIIYYFKNIIFIDEYLIPTFARHHRFISLLLYLIGFLGFVTNLDRGHLRRQFGLFSWIHMSLLLIIVFGQFMVNNILEGLIWFWVPASLVIMNDVAAYVFGMLFGKHQLIKLSPKKTVEGFVGGFFMTVIFGVLWGSLFMGWNYMICPVKDLSMTAFSKVVCTPINPVFEWRTISMGTMINESLVGIPYGGQLSSMIEGFLPSQISWAPFQLHCLVLATFAGLVAPFGGFFASGFKRAFNIKDFGHTIPGHGGLTDRFDCQFIMGLFTYFYYSSMVKEDDDNLIMRSIGNNKQLKFSVISVLQIIYNHLNDLQQIHLYNELSKSLQSRGLIT